MKKALLLSISLFFTHSAQGMLLNAKSPFEQWQERMQQNPDLEQLVDQLLKDEVAKYHPGFTRWTWQGVSGRTRGEWSADFATSTIKIPYPDLLFLSDYVMGKIPKQAITSRLAILHHEITHLIKQHPSAYHPSRIALANVLATQGMPISDEHKQHLIEKASHEMLNTEWEADYGVPNIPNMMHALSGFMKTRPLPQPAEPLSIQKHPHPLARAAAAEDRYAKLKVGQKISTQELRFAQDKLPQITGTTPIKAAKILGIEDPYYYSSFAQEDHPFEVSLVWNDKTITLPYHTAMYSSAIEELIKNNPQPSITYKLNIQSIVGPNILLQEKDIIALKDILTLIEQSFYQGMISAEVTNTLIFFIQQHNIDLIARIAALADLFKIPLIDDAITLYYKHYASPAKRESDKKILEDKIPKHTSDIFEYGAKKIADILTHI